MANALKDKVAVVTGAGRGIGRGIALAFAAEGAKIVVNDPGCAVTGVGGSRDPADSVVQEIRDRGGSAIANHDSVAIMENGERIIKTAVDNFGRLDILINAAGILRDRMIYNMAEEEWDTVIAVHLKGTFACSRFASIVMRQQRSGRIINFASESGLMGNPSQANYGSAKGGISGLTKVTARDLGKYGVTCNCIVPRAATRMTETIPPLAVRRRMLGSTQTPFDDVEGFFAELGYDPENVAPIVVYLASDAAANINGQFFLVYGDEISLLTQPRPIRTIFKDGRWTVDELSHIVPRTLTKGIANPAPPMQTSS